MPVIFISRGTMSGVRRLVDCLHARTGIQCITREDLIKVVNQHGMIATQIVEKLDNATSLYAQFSELRWPYLVLMRQALLEKIRNDNIVYHGFAGHMLLPPQAHFIKMRIEAPLEMRVKMTAERLGCDEERAREYIREADDHRVKLSRFMYAQDIRNTMLYDLHLNLGRMTLDSACRIIENLMQDPDFQATPESQAEVDRMYFATTIEEALVTDPQTSALEISAEVREKGNIRLIGPYLDQTEHKTVMEIAKAVPGVHDVEYLPGYAAKFEIDTHV